MRVLFVLPAPVRVPMGGAVVVYRHAAGLAARGHHVVVAAPRRAGGIAGRVRWAAVRVWNARQGVAEAPLFGASGVRTEEPATWGALSAEAYDAVIATGHQTAPWVVGLTQGEAAVRVYFLQGDERELSPKAATTWSLPLVRIAVSDWLAGTLTAQGYAVAGVVPNAVDPDAFGLDRPIPERAPGLVALYHRHPVKGPEVLVASLRRILVDRPDVPTTVVAARRPRHRLPEGVRIEIRPGRDRLRALFNASTVCLHTSRSEGWGLVPMEAAACGCAVAATASRGPREYLTPGASMLEVPVGDADGLAEAALRLLGDDALRVRLAEAAVADVARFSWDASTARFERILLNAIASP